MDREAARTRLMPYVERAATTTGWMPGAVAASRRLGLPRPWDYEVRARELLGTASTVVDLSTGGGERFATMLDG